VVRVDVTISDELGGGPAKNATGRAGAPRSRRRDPQQHNGGEQERERITGYFATNTMGRGGGAQRPPRGHHSTAQKARR